MKRILTIFVTILISISNISLVYAEEEFSVSYLLDKEIEVLETFDDLKAANSFYTKNIDEYDNLILLNNDKIIKMEYGIVKFKTDSCSLNTGYKSDTNGDSYFNSCYGVDAAYLYSNEDASEVTFKLSADIGTISIDNVELIPYELLETRISSYSTSDNTLHHDINTNLSDNYYSYSIVIDDKPSYLDNNKSYYSYDGHYFYDNFKTMINDYTNDVYDNAVNKDPYYNYYQYLPHRSYTNYSKEEVEDYFTNTLYLDGKIQFYDDLNLDNANDDVNLSQFFDEYDAFFGYEKIYGANAMMMLALSAHESAFGKSYLAFTKNNLFGHAAYDSDPERNASRYNDVSTSIYSHAKYYISRSYAGVHSNVYHGSNFGNKLAGMNVKYSSDPYWGEKAASYYYRFDEALGSKDKDSYALGIIKDANKINVYKDEELESLSFELNDIGEYSVILLEELDNVYKIQVDASYSDEYIYDPEYSIGYIDKDLITYVINEDMIEEKAYDIVTFDFNGGQVIDKDKIEVKTLEGKLPEMVEPKKDGFEFTNYVDGVAQYKEIRNIHFLSKFNKEIEYDYMYNLKGGKLIVTYIDGTNKTVSINSNMIENYDSTIEGESTININYHGVRIDYSCIFSKEIKEARENIDKLIEKNIETYKKDGTYNLEELDYIKESIGKIDYLTSFEMIRYLDEMLLETKRDDINYNFKDSNYDVSISGLALALKDPKELSIFKPFKDTYYVEVKEVQDKSYKRLEEVAKAYDFDVEDAIKVSVKLNMTTASFDTPIIMEVKLQDKKQDKIYSVYHLDKDNNVIKCLTTQSNNYVQFMTRSEGDFMILSMDSVNTYDIEDRYENVFYQNEDPDNHLLFMEGSLLVIVTLLGFIMIVGYYIIKKRGVTVWKGSKKSLPQAESPQEEKPKN